MSNDCGFLANIKEEGTKNTYWLLCQNSAALRTYQANMLKHFPSEKDRTRHQGQSHLTPSGCLCVMRRKRDQAASAAPNSCPAAARREGRQEELAGSPDVRATPSPSPPPPGCRVRGALPGGALSTARSQKLRQKEQHNAFLLLLPRRGRGSPPGPCAGVGEENRCGAKAAQWVGGVPHTCLPRLNAGVNPHGRRPEGRFDSAPLGGARDSARPTRSQVCHCCWLWDRKRN